MKKILIVILCLILGLSLVACTEGTERAGDENENPKITAESTSTTEKKQAEKEPETTNPPGYHSLKITMTTDEIYSTDPYANFIPSNEAMADAGFTNSENYLLGEPEDKKPWTCLSSTWKRSDELATRLVVTVLHVNSPYPYGGGNKTDITVETFDFEVVRVAFEQNEDYVLVKQGDYVVSYSTSLAPTAEDLYALITTAPCFLDLR